MNDEFVYVAVCGRSITEHDDNLRKFNDVAQCYGFAFNYDKSTFNEEKVSLPSYEVSKRIIRPDLGRLELLRNFTLLTNVKSQLTVRLFFYYSQWISHLSYKINPFVHKTEFPQSENAKNTFEQHELYAVLSNSSDLLHLHAYVRHPAVSRMFYFVRVENHPYSPSEV